MTTDRGPHVWFGWRMECEGHICTGRVSTNLVYQLLAMYIVVYGLVALCVVFYYMVSQELYSKRVKWLKITFWDQCYTRCSTAVERWCSDRAAKSTLSYSNVSWYFESIIVVFVLADQLYVITEHSMGHCSIYQTLRVK